MQLRQYQTDLIRQVYQAYREGYRRPCIVLGCGGGKSCIAADIARRTTDKGNRVLFIVHRTELCQQIRDTFEAWGVNMSLCHVSMVQTVTRHLNDEPDPALIITDENHHCLANSYRRIYDNFPNAYCVGITATPVRLDGSGLGCVNDKLITGVSTKWLIENNYLSPYDYYAPALIDTKSLKTRRGEYIVSDLQLTNAIYGDVIEHYSKLSFGKKAICYCATIDHSIEFARRFNQAGIKAAHIDGTTPSDKRSEIINAFRAGEITILSNVDLISEGFDVPDCNTSILLRPTKSLTLYIQQAMRCMRYKPGKRAVIIDHVGNYTRFGLPDDERKWNLNAKKSKEKSQTSVKQCPECYYVFDNSLTICPHCGYVFIAERDRQQLEEIRQAKLQKIQGFVLDYKTPDECHSYSELKAYAKNKGYKPGWVYYQAKSRGFLHDRA